MLHDIYPHTFANEFKPDMPIREDDYVFCFAENNILVKKSGDQYELPLKKDIGEVKSGLFFFTLNDKSCFWVLDEVDLPSDDFVYHDVTSFQSFQQKELDWSTMVARQLKTWYERNKFCGKCGSPNQWKTDERAIVCSSCNNVLYPQIAPAIIVAIFKNDQILLAHNVNFREGFYSLVAGYVDVGESIEDAVRREVREEVGIEIKNIRYYNSQPWPYSGSMMIGFLADADGNQTIQVDNHEIEHADWFGRDNLPNHPIARSIAGEIIDKFVNGEL
ncbi:NAD(+) diphosphatase [Carboxylicivirga caseinilyticus]|uniref:NAD(+) diphosphatase n=1 Tax=Carboxylicivirga caseinilyticus TaxID=3417572 RepID=UPI003D32CBEF|nr:NAD(+) diphosphatase [Marinilabiliaceae bacterium A049]